MSINWVGLDDAAATGLIEGLMSEDEDVYG